MSLRALYLSENRPTPPPPPDKGTVTGRVIDATTNQPLASVSVVSGQLSATTTNTGEFTLSDIPQGSQTITFTLSGYATATATVNIAAGSIINLGTVPLSTNPTTGIIKGTVTDAANGQPLSGVTITVSGTFSGSTTTGAAGTFIFTNVTPGSATITATKTGYYPVTGTGTVAAGGILFFNPRLSTTPPPTTTGNLTGKVYDASTNKPILGAAVSISGGPSGSTDSQGVFLIKDLSPNTYQATISAAGYTSQSYQVMITEGATTDIQTIYLSPSPQSTTVTGKVTDAETGEPIAGAEVLVVGTAFSTKTDSTGTYTISGITALEFNLKASAVGYNNLIHIISLNSHGVYTIDFTLSPSRPSDLKIVSLTTDKLNYPAYAPVSIIVTIQSNSTETISGAVSLTVENAQGQVVDYVPGITRWDSNTVVIQNSFTVLPGETTAVAIPWYTNDFPPGAYTIIAHAVIDNADIGGGTVIAAERAVEFSIDPTQALSSLVLSPIPRFANFGATEQMSIIAVASNLSNVAMDIVIAYEWRSPSGLLLHNATGAISLLPSERSKAVTLDTFPFTFTESGSHPLSAGIVSGPTPARITAGVVSIAPNVHIEPGQIVDPETVLPDGDKRIRIKIHLKGVEAKP